MIIVAATKDAYTSASIAKKAVVPLAAAQAVCQVAIGVIYRVDASVSINLDGIDSISVNAVGSRAS